MATAPVRFFDAFGRLMPTRISQAAIGSQLQSASAGDVQSSRIITEGAYGRLAKVQRALWLLDPDTYPITSIPPTRSVAVMGSAI